MVENGAAAWMPEYSGTKCTRRGNWCIKGSESKNILTYVTLFKRQATISTTAMEAMVEFIDALEQRFLAMFPVAYRGTANYEPESWQIELQLIWA